MVQAAEQAELVREPELAPDPAEQVAPVAALAQERVGAILPQPPPAKAHQAARVAQTRGQR